VQPNAADPERLFSLLGQIVTPSRTLLSDNKVTHFSTISADVRDRRLTNESADRKMSCANIRRFTTLMAAVLALARLETGANLGTPQVASEVQVVPQRGETNDDD
jgi:hypothetical protein